MSKISLGAVKSRAPRRAKHAICKEVAGKGILLNLKSGAYFEMNRAALSIWQACDGKKTLEQISQQIARRHRIPPDRAAKDVRSFVGQLKRREAILIPGAPAGR